MSFIDAVDNSPLFKMLTEIVMTGPGKLAGAVGAALVGAKEVLSSSVAGIGNSVSESRSSNVAAPAQEAVHSKGIERSVERGSQYDVGMDSLGSLSPMATPSRGGMGQSVGR